MSKIKVYDLKQIAAELLTGEAQIYLSNLEKISKNSQPLFPIITGARLTVPTRDGNVEAPSFLVPETREYQEWHSAQLKEISNRLTLDTAKPLTAEDVSGLTLEQIMAVINNTRAKNQTRQQERGKERKTRSKTASTNGVSEPRNPIPSEAELPMEISASA